MSMWIPHEPQYVLCTAQIVSMILATVQPEADVDPT